MLRYFESMKYRVILLQQITQVQEGGKLLTCLYYFNSTKVLRKQGKSLPTPGLPDGGMREEARRQVQVPPPESR